MHNGIQFLRALFLASILATIHSEPLAQADPMSFANSGSAGVFGQISQLPGVPTPPNSLGQPSSVPAAQAQCTLIQTTPGTQTSGMSPASFVNGFDLTAGTNQLQTGIAQPNLFGQGGGQAGQASMNSGSNGYSFGSIGASMMGSTDPSANDATGRMSTTSAKPWSYGNPSYSFTGSSGSGQASWSMPGTSPNAYQGFGSAGSAR